MVNVDKKKQNTSREMTPEWLKNNSHEQINAKTTEYTEEERQAFLKRMKQNKDE
ncbi:hypothetical protein [Staphylococcus gallinarum]|uniref:hypothetical protein n=1 Tax=Staphylococcus gallinarum TaxID=1293 RepID=UPI0015FBF795|nr:hypothetical protein [Staphylococcus gallinarum]